MIRSLLLVFVLVSVAAVVQAQPAPPRLPGQGNNPGGNNFMAAGSGGGALQNALLQNALASQMFAAQPTAAFNQPMFTQPQIQPQLMAQLGAQANPLLNVPAAQSFGAFPNIQSIQPSIPALGSVGSIAFQQPLGAAQFPMAATATVPAMHNVMTTSLPLGVGAATPITGTVPPVLPQNFGMPAATYGVLPQPILSQAQAEQLIPMAQLQQALNQRVQTLAAQPITQPIAANMPINIPQTVF